jgi:DNA-binding PadR family transcriptional regulator
VIVSGEIEVVQMRTSKCAGWNFDAGLWDVLSQAGEAFDQAIRATTAGAWRGGPWERGAGGRGRHGHWGGGNAGAWAGFWPGPGPGAQRSSKAGRGDVRAAILALLKEGPRTGYQIMSDINERSDGAWRPSPGAVYPALSQLADEGLIEGEESGGRRTFSLTQAGLDYLEQHPEMARAAWESMAQQDRQETWDVPGLLAEAAKLGGGIMQVAQLGTAEQVVAAERLLERTRRELFQILADDFTPDGEETGEADETKTA